MPFRALAIGVSALFCGLLLASPVLAQTAKPPPAKRAPAAPAAKSIGKFEAWEGYVLAGKDKVCYVTSLPVKSENAPKGRGRVYATITDRPAENSFQVVSFAPGFPFKKDAPVSLAVGSAKFDLYTAINLAWSSDDKGVVAALQKGKSMVVQSTPDKGNPVSDEFSLAGLSQALTAIGKACAAK